MSQNLTSGLICFLLKPHKELAHFVRSKLPSPLFNKHITSSMFLLAEWSFFTISLKFFSVFYCPSKSICSWPNIFVVIKIAFSSLLAHLKRVKNKFETLIVPLPSAMCYIKASSSAQHSYVSMLGRTSQVCIVVVEINTSSNILTSQWNLIFSPRLATHHTHSKQGNIHNIFTRKQKCSSLTSDSMLLLTCGLPKQGVYVFFVWNFFLQLQE